MVNPLLIVPFLNASTLTTPKNGCYDQNPPGEPQRTDTTITVCNQAIHHMTIGHALDYPTVFGHTVKVGHKVPDSFVQKGLFGSCVVNIDIEDGEQDTLTWREIIVSAIKVRDDCVALYPHLGGEKKVGRRQLLDVKVYGISHDVSSNSAVS